MGRLLASREVRWFLDGTADNSTILRDWIERRDPFDEEGVFLKEGIWKGRRDDQPDVYAVVPGADDMGIKWREGELQIKGRRETIGIQAFEGTAQGRVEQWLKWSYHGAAIEAAFRHWFDPESARAVTVIPVSKTRALRKIHVDGLGRLLEVPGSAYPDRAVNVELTQLHVFGVAYWSVGIEAFPDDSNMAAAFSTVASRFLGRLSEINLDVANSNSYPSWLSRLSKVGM